ncbi:MAG: hypothetical protein KGI28_05150 [Thaumarchaeota archaeon]|nr:hypothetical protein [Nitrososphaerota archaeon]
MNTQELVRNKKMLALIIGVAIFATAGVSVASAQTADPSTTGQTNTPPQIQGSIVSEQLLLSSVKTDFSTAATTAAGAVTNGKVIGGMLTEKQGFLVYAFRVIDDKNMVYSVIVDPGNGSVLYTSPGHAFSMGGFGMGQGGMRHGHHMGGQGWNKQTPSSGGTASPSGSTNPSDYTTPSGLQ